MERIKKEKVYLKSGDIIKLKNTFNDLFLNTTKIKATSGLRGFKVAGSLNQQESSEWIIYKYNQKKGVMELGDYICNGDYINLQNVGNKLFFDASTRHKSLISKQGDTSSIEVNDILQTFRGVFMICYQYLDFNHIITDRMEIKLILIEKIQNTTLNFIVCGDYQLEQGLNEVIVTQNFKEKQHIWKINFVKPYNLKFINTMMSSLKETIKDSRTPEEFLIYQNKFITSQKTSQIKNVCMGQYLVCLNNDLKSQSKEYISSKKKEISLTSWDDVNRKSLWIFNLEYKNKENIPFEDCIQSGDMITLKNVENNMFLSSSKNFKNAILNQEAFGEDNESMNNSFLIQFKKPHTNFKQGTIFSLIHLKTSQYLSCCWRESQSKGTWLVYLQEIPNAYCDWILDSK